eukprot:SAG31_NODE_16755_length_697_cov_1.274247_1_plen_137_part_00
MGVCGHTAEHIMRDCRDEREAHAQKREKRARDNENGLSLTYSRRFLPVNRLATIDELLLLRLQRVVFDRVPMRYTQLKESNLLTEHLAERTTKQRTSLPTAASAPLLEPYLASPAQPTNIDDDQAMTIFRESFRCV